MKEKIIHLTSVHDRYDTRIFKKQCCSLASNGYDVTLVVADGKGSEIKNGVNIVDLGSSLGRFRRIIFKTMDIYKYAKESDAEIIHIHDPELLLVGLMLKSDNAKVVFDAHEDFPKQLLSKPYLNFYLRKPVSYIASFIEKLCCSRYDFIITATPHIENKFYLINPSTLAINNYPILNELASKNVLWNKKKTL